MNRGNGIETAWGSVAVGLTNPSLAKLITGVYIPEAGEIRLDGIAIGDRS